MGNSNVINVLLEQDIDALDAVIVIACDIIPKKLLQGQQVLLRLPI
ncbi:MAG: hypothetical protein ACI9WV_000922 [Patiriisocius sp.]